MALNHAFCSLKTFEALKAFSVHMYKYILTLILKKIYIVFVSKG